MEQERREQRDPGEIAMEEASKRALWLLAGVIMAAMFSACVVLLFCQAFIATPPK